MPSLTPDPSTRSSLDEQSDPLIKAISRAPSGLSVSDLLRHCAADTTRRTLQRRLARLAEMGVLHISGQGRGTRYVVNKVASDSAGGYEHTLISEYRPNIEAYLPDTLRQGFRALNRAVRARHAAAVSKRTQHRLITTVLARDWSPELVWNGARLAEVDCDRAQVNELLNSGTSPPGLHPRDAQTVLNLADAIAFLREPTTTLNETTLCNLHAMLSDNLLADPGKGGRLRCHTYAATPCKPAQVLQLLVAHAQAIEDPFEQSFFLFLHLSYLQLFEHGNLRLARMAANLPLLRANLCPVLFIGTPLSLYRHALDEVATGLRFNAVRDLYARAYEESCGFCIRIPMPDAVNPLRLTYRSALRETVRHMVQTGMNRQAATAYLAIPAAEQGPNRLPAALHELVIEELDALHPGNIFRHGLSIKQFSAWRDSWKPR